MKNPQNIFETARLMPVLDLFSVVMVFNRELEIVYSSETLSRHMPAVVEGSTLFENFELVRPASAATFDDIELNRNSLFLMRATDDSFAVRGQVINGSSELGDFMVFCGAPWLAWMTANQPDTKLGLKDFAPQDAQIDQLFYMETENRMVADLEQLNTELRSAHTSLEASEAARSAFFAQMSHEMRTPLNGVVSALALMREQKPEGQVGKLLDLASKSSDNLMQVINYVLDVSKLESADVEPAEQVFDLEDLTRSVIEIVQARAMEKNLVLHSHMDEGLARDYVGDSPRLRQVLLNLVINAIKFTERGAVSVTVSPAECDGQTLRIEVADTGVGIPKDMQARIFEPFARLEQDEAGATEEGTGLGLDIVRRNIDTMGGRIGLASSPGVGSTFWIELPLEAVAADERPVAAGPDVSSDEEKFAGRVLLVDDNETNLMLGTMILEGMGVRVLQANGGEIAVAMALQEDLDLVLMDISMPGMDGYDATRLIRKERGADLLPVVALTAYASSEEREKSVAAGMNDYLTKPIERDQLRGVLSRWLAHEPVGDQPGDDGDVSGEDQLDMSVIESMLQQIGRDNLNLVIGKFRDEATVRWLALENAATSADLAREAHTLASTCKSFGLPVIAEKLQGIEAAAKAGRSVKGLDGLPGLGVTLERGLDALQARARALLN